MHDIATRKNRAALGGWARVLIALSLLLVSLGTAPVASAKPRPPGAAEGTKVPYFDDPFARLAFDMRLALSLRRNSAQAFNPYLNVAVNLVDPTTLTPEELNARIGMKDDGRGVAYRGVRVSLYDMRQYLKPAAFTRLANAGENEILAVASINYRGKHSEPFLEQNLPPNARKLAGFSDRRQCATCSPLYDSETPTFYSEEYDLTPEEVAQREQELAAVKGDKKAQAQIKEEFQKLQDGRNTEAAQRLDEDITRAKSAYQREENSKRKSANQYVANALGQPNCPDNAAGVPGGGVRMSVLAAGNCGESEASGLDKGLSALNDYGGVDFSTLGLRYLSDHPGSGGVRYSFSGRSASPGVDQNIDSGLDAVRTSAADLRTWLVLDPNKFWVNLNPTEPGRVVDSQLGRTNAGKALLEADLQMKRTEGKLLDPATPLGARYWDALAGPSGKVCYSSRLWIVPGDVEVREDGSSLYILKATLHVKAKAQQIGDGYGCDYDQASEARGERLEQTMLVPKVEQAVNTAPEYAPLRRAFLARVVAQWIRDRHQSGHHTSFDGLLDSSDLGPAVLQDGWRPRQVFDAYVRSIRDKDFTYRQTTRVGGTRVVLTLTYGGVDFSKVKSARLSAAQMNQRLPRLPQTVDASNTHPAKAADGSIWLGETAGSADSGLLSRVTGTIGAFVTGRAGILILIIAALVLVTFGIRSGSGPRRRAS